MDIILLERIAKLGMMGETVSVKPGYARNFLFPQGKALRATKENLERFQSQRAQLEARDLQRRQDAEKIAEKLADRTFLTIRAAAETGQLYGSVSTHDIVELLAPEGFIIARSQLQIDTPVKTIGLHKIGIHLHPEVMISIMINVARSADEGERQLKNEKASSDSIGESAELTVDAEENDVETQVETDSDSHEIE